MDCLGKQTPPNPIVRVKTPPFDGGCFIMHGTLFSSRHRKSLSEPASASSAFSKRMHGIKQYTLYHVFGEITTSISHKKARIHRTFCYILGC